MDKPQTDLADLPLAAQVGQLIAGRVHGPVLDADGEAILRDCHLGGVVLFADNIGTPEETRALTARIQEICGQPGLPAIVAVDQEGGRVQRLHAPATSFPSAMALGATGDPEHARRWGLATARELRALGITMNFAPTLDVNNNPGNPVIGTRSFGERPEDVARFGLAAAAGLREGGVAATGKHFPGHGDTALDSHYALPTIAGGRERLRRDRAAAVPGGDRGGYPGDHEFAHRLPRPRPRWPPLHPLAAPAHRPAARGTRLRRRDRQRRDEYAGDRRPLGDRGGLRCASSRRAATCVEPIGEERAVHAALLAAVESGRIPATRLADALAPRRRAAGVAGDPKPRRPRLARRGGTPRLGGGDRARCRHPAARRCGAPAARAATRGSPSSNSSTSGHSSTPPSAPSVARCWKR